MKEANKEKSDQFWDLIENEKKKDAWIKRISKIGWSMTVVVLLVFLFLTVMDLVRTYELYAKGAVSYETVVTTIIPFLTILGVLSLIVAILGTVGTFLRLRTTSLIEIQQRLNHLEDIITSGKK